MQNQTLQEMVAYSLSSSDIAKVLHGVKIVSYPDVHNYSDIKDLFDSRGRCVLFFVEEKQGQNVVGHWECVFQQNPDTIVFFDSYGLKPDGCEKWLNANQQRSFNESGPMLAPLLSKAMDEGTKVLYNHVRLQEYANDVDTCGDFVCTRLLRMDLPHDQFIQFLDKLKSTYNVPTYDDAVAEYIHGILSR